LLSFNLEEERLIEEIIKRKAKKILIQLPNGLKPSARFLHRKIEEKTNAVAYFSADPCYGGCDLAVEDARRLNVDLIAHYGHTPFPSNEDVQTVYFEARARYDVSAIVQKAKNLLLGFRKVGLVTTVQHLQDLESVKESLEKTGLKVIIPKAAGLTKYDGQVIGCDYSPLKSISEQVDSYLVIASTFHALGAALTVNKPVISVDPYSNEVKDVERLKRRTLRQRYAFILKARGSNLFGVIIGLKLAQYNPNLALTLRELIRKKGKHAILLCAREVTPEVLANFPEVEVFVNTACPRLAIDNPERFKKPILNPNETLVAMDEISWEDLTEKGLF
jgi:2-(3-amino-3-carboxypropyl)histidine synthase